MRRTKDDTETTRQAIMDAAIRVFSRQGYAVTRLEDIAHQAGVMRGAIYHHFGGKVELYEALTQERFAGAMAGIAQIMMDGLSPRNTIRRLMIYSLELLEQDALYRTVQELSFFKTAYSRELESLMQVKVRNTKDFLNPYDEEPQRGRHQHAEDRGPTTLARSGMPARCGASR